MRTDRKMSFRDFIFPVNPSVIKIEGKRNLSISPVPGGMDNISDNGRHCMSIRGQGEFFGEDCCESFNRLKTLFEEGKAGMLYIPSQRPVFAFFSRLEMTAEDIENVIGYSFEFREIPGGFSYHREQSAEYGDGKSSLWDISYRLGIHIDLLVSLNPHIKRPDIPVMPWEKVILC